MDSTTMKVKWTQGCLRTEMKAFYYQKEIALSIEILKLFPILFFRLYCLLLSVRLRPPPTPNSSSSLILTSHVQHCFRHGMCPVKFYPVAKTQQFTASLNCFNLSSSQILSYRSQCLHQVQAYSHFSHVHGKRYTRHCLFEVCSHSR